MSPKMTWQDVLTRPQNGHHIAQVYQDPNFLVEAASVFIGAGLRGGEGVVAVVTRPHWQVFLQRLEKTGLRPWEALERGQLRFFDADETLSRFMSDDVQPDW